MSKIYDFNLAYNYGKRYIVFTFKRFYGECIVLGKENIPADCPVIFAPNHTNALMDALAVAASVPHYMSVVFLARADLFRNKTVAKILRFAKIMPAFRMRDGVENLSKNAQIFEHCTEVLDNNQALCIMPEGNQEIERKLRPIVKGIFRIAFTAQHKFGTEKRVKIIPVGLDFGSIFKAGKHIIIHFGKPIEVADYMAEYATHPVAATNRIRKRLHNDLAKISLNLASEKHYHCFETATEVCNSEFVKELNLTNNTANRYIARLKIAEKLVDIEKKHPEEAGKLALLCSNYSTMLKELNLRNQVLEKPSFKIPQALLELLTLVLSFPIYLYGLTVNFLPFFTPVFLRKKVFKPEFSGFFSSLHYGLGAITFPLFYTIETILFARLTSLPWYYGFLFLLSLYPSGKIALKWNSKVKKFCAKLRLNRYLRTCPGKIKQVQQIRQEIIETVIPQKKES